MIREHLEKYLGASEAGWIEETLPFQVWRFAAQPVPGAYTYATVGLSQHLLSQPGDRSIKQELVFSCYERFGSIPIEKRLFGVGREILGRHEPLARGQVLGPRGPLFKGAALEALLCLAPIFFPDGFRQFTDEMGTDVVMTWLVPLHSVDLYGETLQVVVEGDGMAEREISSALTSAGVRVVHLREAPVSMEVAFSRIMAEVAA